MKCCVCWVANNLLLLIMPPRLIMPPLPALAQTGSNCYALAKCGELVGSRNRCCW